MCQTIRLPNGTFAIFCGGHHKRRRCVICKRPSTIQCDYPRGDGRTCDKHLCRLCAVPKGKNADWCKSHIEAQPTVLSPESVDNPNA